MVLAHFNDYYIVFCCETVRGEWIHLQGDAGYCIRPLVVFQRYCERFVVRSTVRVQCFTPDRTGEHCIPCTWDMFHERFGWMLNFWVRITYSLSQEFITSYHIIECVRSSFHVLLSVVFHLLQPVVSVVYSIHGVYRGHCSNLTRWLLHL